MNAGGSAVGKPNACSSRGNAGQVNRNYNAVWLGNVVQEREVLNGTVSARRRVLPGEGCGRINHCCATKRRPRIRCWYVQRRSTVNGRSRDRPARWKLRTQPVSALLASKQPPRFKQPGSSCTVLAQLWVCGQRRGGGGNSRRRPEPPGNSIGRQSRKEGSRPTM